MLRLLSVVVTEVIKFTGQCLIQVGREQMMWLYAVPGQQSREDYEQLVLCEGG